ncbi:VOC family protein [Candidatus Leptofilum sp.]|uniref:VOC family protein n=1 Tax=Candidatus Leptofilum sp. TaxID=3241576 RepID=UPI003B58D93F
MNKLTIASQITFLYYKDLAAAQQFYEGILGLELVEDQGWAKIYQVNGTAFVGLVDEAHGSLKTQPENAVMITFVVDDVSGWYQHLRENSVTILREYGRSESIQIEYFFAEDPGGYTLEFERFLKPELTAVFNLPES